MNYHNHSREQVAQWLKNIRETRSDISISKCHHKTLSKEEHRKRIEREVKRRLKDNE